MPQVSDARAILAYLDTPTARVNNGVPLETGAVVTYSFPTTPVDGLFFGADGSSQFTASQQAITREAIAKFEAETGLIFVEVPPSAGAMIEFHNVWGTGNTFAYASLPLTGRNTAVPGGLAMDISLLPPPWSQGDFDFLVLIHEIGHAVGLEHPFEGTFTLPVSLDNTDYTVMSYTDVTTNPYRSDLGPLDKDALKQLYGDPAGWSGNWNASLERIEIRLSPDADKIIATPDDTFIAAFGGNDVVYGRSGADIILGQAGNDVLFGGSGRDRLNGNMGNDGLLGEGGNDVLIGQDGADRLRGQAGNDALFGGNDSDLLYGGNGNDWLYGGAGNDALRGDAGNDVLRGGPGNDVLIGHGGNDILGGDEGNDVLLGAGGVDVFIFTEGDDRIADWADGERIRIDVSENGTNLTVSQVINRAEVIGGDTVLTLSDGNTLTIDGLTNPQLLNGDLVFI